jgi:hypothetical protein
MGRFAVDYVFSFPCNVVRPDGTLASRFSPTDDKFKELFGVKEAIFQDMLTILTAARNE